MEGVPNTRTTWQTLMSLKACMLHGTTRPLLRVEHSSRLYHWRGRKQSSELQHIAICYACVDELSLAIMLVYRADTMVFRVERCTLIEN